MSDFLIADDLSGALDAAAAFHHCGRRVTIVLSAAAWPRGDANDLVAFTTETRNATPAAAAAAVTRALERGRAQGGRLVYKKIDSTLRGPVAAELGALAAAMPERHILFAPANPAVGRTVRDGVLLVQGVPVAETEFARDPASPVQESVIQRLLGDVATGRLTIADAVRADDLEAAVAKREALAEPWIAVGSGALARPVAARFAGETASIRRKTVPAPDLSALLSGPARPPTGDPATGRLMICGSAHAGNRVQAALLARERGVPVHELRVDQPAAAVEGVVNDLRSSHGATLMLEERRGDRGAALHALVETVVQTLAASKVRRVFVTGGETAFGLCAALGISTLAFQQEIEAGLSLSRAETADGVFRFAVKPGGFGDDQTWVRAWDALALEQD